MNLKDILISALNKREIKKEEKIKYLELIDSLSSELYLEIEINSLRELKIEKGIISFIPSLRGGLVLSGLEYTDHSKFRLKFINYHGQKKFCCLYRIYKSS